MAVAEYKGVALVVDDSADNRDLFSLVLGQLSLKVVLANNGKEAVATVSEMIKNRDRLDVIFIDIMMPEMSGVDASREIRSLGYKGPLLAFSANTALQTSKAAKEAGVDHYFEKSTFNTGLAKALTLIHCGLEL